MNATEITSVERYLRTRFNNPGLSVKARTTKDDSADVVLNSEFLGVLVKVVDEGETSYDLQVKATDVADIEHYLQTRFNNAGLSVKARTTKNDSADVVLDDEFLGVVYNEEVEDRLSYDFNMTILEMDLK